MEEGSLEQFEDDVYEFSFLVEVKVLAIDWCSRTELLQGFDRINWMFDRYDVPGRKLIMIYG